MQIDRSNYEIWFIDWLDGNLSSMQADQLKLFLSQNPDLREEFNELTAVSIVPYHISFPDKNQLKRSASDITPSQFEHLCVAFLENDLSVSQQTELKEIIDTSTEKKETFDLIQKTRLTPTEIKYKHKSLLLKRTSIQKVIRLSVTGLSAAAAIALIIILFSTFPENISLKSNKSAQNLVSDSTLQRPSSVIKRDNINTDIAIESVTQRRDSKIAKIQNKSHINTYSDFTNAISDDSSVKKTDNQQVTVNKVPVSIHVFLDKGIISSNTLITSNSIEINPEVEEERSKIGRFISKTFREKLLKEKTPTDKPLKGYEIAAVGVSGINKLFGWEMALNEKNDENGQIKSVYFSSKILKFSAPVKNSEPKP
jgi:hypothetical protein